MQNGSSVGIHTHFIHVFALLVPICMLSRCLATKIYASDLSRKFIECVVGWARSRASSWATRRRRRRSTARRSPTRTSGGCPSPTPPPGRAASTSPTPRRGSGPEGDRRRCPGCRTGTRPSSSTCSRPVRTTTTQPISLA